MDRVRFGRALGYGARHAAKAVVKAVDAAAAPNPAGPPSATAVRPETVPRASAATAEGTTSAAERGDARGFGPAASQTTSQTSPGRVAARSAQGRASVRQATAQAGHLRRHMWSPLAKFSSVVWLQVTGTFFALLAAFLSQGLWKERAAAALPVSSPEAEKLYLHAAAFAIFVYFAVSSFVRAYLRQRDDSDQRR